MLMSARTSCAFIALAVALSLGVVTPVRAGKNGCGPGFNKCLSRKVACLLKVEADARVAGTAPSSEKLQKCRDEFDGGSDPTQACFAKVDAAAEGCDLTPTTASRENDIDTFTNDVVSALDPNPADDRNACTVGKLRCVRSLVKCFFNVSKETSDRGYAYTSWFQRCRDIFAGRGNTPIGCFGQREAAGGCLTIGDSTALDSRVECYMSTFTAYYPDPWNCPTPTPVPTP
jgi:hypothetical protein